MAAGEWAPQILISWKRYSPRRSERVSKCWMSSFSPISKPKASLNPTWLSGRVRHLGDVVWLVHRRGGGRSDMV